MEEALSSSRGPLLASLSAFWLRLSEKASSLEGERCEWEVPPPLPRARMHVAPWYLRGAQ